MQVIASPVKIYFNMTFDRAYFDRLTEFFIKNQGKTYTVKELSTAPVKFIHHVKEYVDNRRIIKGYVDISFNNEYTIITIHEEI